MAIPSLGGTERAGTRTGHPCRRVGDLVNVAEPGHPGGTLGNARCRGACIGAIPGGPCRQAGAAMFHPGPIGVPFAMLRRRPLVRVGPTAVVQDRYRRPPPVFGMAVAAPPAPPAGPVAKREAMDDHGLYAALVQRGMTRRSFLKFSTAMAAALALPASYAPADRRGRRAPPRGCRSSGSAARPAAATPRRSSAPPTRRVSDAAPRRRSRVEYHESLLATAGAARRARADERDGALPGRLRRRHRGRDPDGRRRAPTAWSAAARSATSSARSATAPWPRSRSARAPSTAARRRRAAARRTPRGSAASSGDGTLVTLPGLPDERRQPGGRHRPLPHVPGAGRRSTRWAGRSSPTGT